MPYCSGCGSRYQEGDRVCKSCGFELMEDTDPKTTGKSSASAAKKERATAVTKKSTRKKKTDSQPKPELTEASPKNTAVNETEAFPEVTAVPCTPDKRQLQSEVIAMPANWANEIHLGKGIIKPKAVEVGLDGYHFKYEEQPHSFKKPDNISREYGAELRVVNPDFDKDQANSTVADTPAPTEAEKQHNPAAAEISFSLADSDISGEGTVENPETVLQDTLEADMRELVTLLEECEIDEGLEPANLDTDWERQLAKESDETVPIITELIAEASCTPVIESPEIKAVEPVIGPAVGSGEPETTTPTVVAAEKEQTESAQLIEAVEIFQAQDNKVINDNDTETVDTETVQSQSTAERLSSTAREDSDIKILWQGHQSWFGIPFPDHVCLSERRLTLTGQNGHIVEISVNDIKHITVKQSWLAKLLGIGDVIIDLKQQVPSRQILSGVSNPVKLRTLLEDLVNKAL